MDEHGCAVEVAWGWCGLVCSERGLSVCTLPQRTRALAAVEAGVEATGESADALLREAAELLARYYEGERVSFDLPLAPRGVTQFGGRVLEACRSIPWGDTRSYGELAEMAGSPGAARAVGQALGRNPLPVIVPCHRVIGADGGLVGFGAGLDVKRRLLAHEGIAR